jgi:hypothetical protein
MQYMVWEECVVDANGDIDLDRSRYSWSNQKPDLCKSGGGGGTVVQQPAHLLRQQNLNLGKNKSHI